MELRIVARRHHRYRAIALPATLIGNAAHHYDGNPIDFAHRLVRITRA